MHELKTIQDALDLLDTLDGYGLVVTDTDDVTDRLRRAYELPDVAPLHTPMNARENAAWERVNVVLKAVEVCEPLSLEPETVITHLRAVKDILVSPIPQDVPAIGPEETETEEAQEVQVARARAYADWEEVGAMQVIDVESGATDLWDAAKVFEGRYGLDVGFWVQYLAQVLRERNNIVVEETTGCPKCGSTELKIDATEYIKAYVSFDGPDDHDMTDSRGGSVEWEEDAATECRGCHHHGPLNTFKIPYLPEED